MGLHIVGRIHSYESLAPLFPVVDGVVTPLIEEFTLDKYRIKASSLRYKCFFLNRRCFACGLEGRFFKIQREQNHPVDRAHINMYGYDPVVQSKHILFTKDHIVPKSEGGTDDLSNLVTMCHVCNGNKSNIVVGRSPLAILKIREDRLEEQLKKHADILANPDYWSSRKSSDIQKRIQKRDHLVGYLTFLSLRKAELLEQVNNKSEPPKKASLKEP